MTYNYYAEGRKKRQIKQLFSDFVSGDVLREIQEHPESLSLRGHHCTGTVLFCDLAGFTTLSERASPEHLLGAMDAYLSEASQALMARGAYIDKFIGDAVMAVFNVPNPQADHAFQACFSALELQEMMKPLNDRLSEKYGPMSLSLRVGVNSGEMIAGPMGYARKMNYTVLGDTVNLASRLEGANKAYSTKIMVGPLTYEATKDRFEFRILDFLKVKGKHEPVRVYELMSQKNQLPETLRKTRDLYLQGVERYRQQQWIQAVSVFDEALNLSPHDGPSLAYRERCLYFSITPPMAPWDGSFGLDVK
jgi:adenylate cyclase